MSCCMPRLLGLIGRHSWRTLGSGLLRPDQVPVFRPKLPDRNVAPGLNGDLSRQGGTGDPLLVCNVVHVPHGGANTNREGGALGGRKSFDVGGELHGGD